METCGTGFQPVFTQVENRRHTRPHFRNHPHRRTIPTELMSMRVLHVIPTASSEAGAIGLLLPGLIEALEPVGARSQVLAAEPHLSDDTARTLDPGASRLPLVREAEEAVDRADVVHFHGWSYEGVRRVVRAVRRVGKPFLVSPLGSLSAGPHRPPVWRTMFDNWFGFPRLARSAGRISAIHGREADALHSAGFVNRVGVLPYGHRFSDTRVPAEAVASLPPALPGRCLLVLGPLEPVEGCVPLLKAFAELGADANEWHLTLAGRDTGQWHHVLAPAVRRKGGEERVQFHPAPDETTQRAWLSRASVLVAASLGIRPPVSVLQAIATGVPVVATDLVAPDEVREVVQVCNPDRAGLRDALRTVMRMSDAQRTERAKLARSRAAATLDWSVLAPKYVEQYERMLHPGQRSADIGAVAAA